MEDQLLRGERNQRVRALVSCRSRAEHDRHQRRECARVCRSGPGNEILDVLALGCAENGKEQGSGRLSTIAGRSDDAERAFADPTAASFVAERRPPAAAANDLARWTATVGNGAGADNEQYSSAILERIIERDEAIGVDHYFLGEILCIQSGLQSATLFLATGAGDPAVENAGNYHARLGDFRDALYYQLGDDVGRLRRFPRYDG